MKKYIFGAIAGVSFLLILTHIMGVWSLSQITGVKMSRPVNKEITQEPAAKKPPEEKPAEPKPEPKPVEPEPVVKEEPIPPYPYEQPEWFAKTENLLKEKKAAVSFNDTRLEDALYQLAEMAGIPLRIDPTIIQELPAVTLDIEDAALITALKKLLSAASQLSFQIQENGIYVAFSKDIERTEAEKVSAAIDLAREKLESAYNEAKLRIERDEMDEMLTRKYAATKFARELGAPSSRLLNQQIRELKIHQIIQVLQKETDFQIIAEKDLWNDSTKISAPGQNPTLGEVLEYMREKLKLDYIPFTDETTHKEMLILLKRSAGLAR